jgi:hypothetical protein
MTKPSLIIFLCVAIEPNIEVIPLMIGDHVLAMDEKNSVVRVKETDCTCGVRVKIGVEWANTNEWCVSVSGEKQKALSY